MQRHNSEDLEGVSVRPFEALIVNKLHTEMSSIRPVLEVIWQNVLSDRHRGVGKEKKLLAVSGGFSLFIH